MPDCQAFLPHVLKEAVSKLTASFECYTSNTSKSLIKTTIPFRSILPGQMYYPIFHRKWVGGKWLYRFFPI